jgi:hypothetical protein
MFITVTALDTTRRKHVFDGVEPADWTQRIQIPLARPDDAFSFAEIAGNPFAKLQPILGLGPFADILRHQGYRDPDWELPIYRGEDGLPLHYGLRPDPQPASVRLLLVSFGEFQPARYLAHVEGIYRVTGARFTQ